MSDFKTELEELIGRYITSENDAVLAAYIEECLNNYKEDFQQDIPDDFKEAFKEAEEIIEKQEEEVVEQPDNKPHSSLENQSGHPWFDGTSWGTNR